MNRPCRRTIVLVALTLSAVSFGTLFNPASLSGALAADEPRVGKFEVYQDKSGDFRWRLLASNGQVVATSGQGYKKKDDCLNGIESVKRIAGDSKVEEVKEPPAEGK